MNLHSYQDAVMGGLLDKDADFDNLLITSVLGLCGESGEVADLLKKSRHQGVELDRDEMLDELGDVLWYLSRLLTLHDVTFDELAEMNMRKLAQRWPKFYGYLFAGSGWKARGEIDRRADHPGPGVTNADLGRLGPVREEHR